MQNDDGLNLQSRTLIELKNCSIGTPEKTILTNLNWSLQTGQTWLITGANGCGKSAFTAALTGELPILPAQEGSSFNALSGSVVRLSFEEASTLIIDERARDDSDFIEGGLDSGRTPRDLLKTLLNTELPMENSVELQLYGIVPILDRGLKFLSTGEMRRTQLALALISKPALLILDEPFEGLDTASRAVLTQLFAAQAQQSDTHIILVLDSPHHIPDFITHVLTLGQGTICFSGTAAEFTLLSESQKNAVEQTRSRAQAVMEADLAQLLSAKTFVSQPAATLILMRDVSVEWSGRAVLRNINWTLRKGEHTLVRGPNGSGKTTLLELITGDNPQVFRNDVWLFGQKRGSGETIWELKEKMGIVSYRLHLEYRMVGDIDVEGVLISGLHDSIGLYQERTAGEKELARQWLNLADMGSRAADRFSNLSWGEQRALLILRAAVKCPPLLILDEPCHGLDETHRAIVLDLLQKIAESGHSTLLHVTHNPEEVLPCERQILELRPGENPMYKLSTLP